MADVVSADQPVSTLKLDDSGTDDASTMPTTHSMNEEGDQASRGQLNFSYLPSSRHSCSHCQIFEVDMGKLEPTAGYFLSKLEFSFEDVQQALRNKCLVFEGFKIGMPAVQLNEQKTPPE